MDADFSTQALHYQTTALRNTRLAQDASLVPWAGNAEILKTTAVAQLHRIAGFSPGGGFSGGGWEYQFLYNTLYTLEAPQHDAQDLYQLVLTWDATLVVRYRAAEAQSLESLLEAAFGVGARAFRARWRSAADVLFDQAGYGAVVGGHTLEDALIMKPPRSKPVYQQDEPLRPGVTPAQGVLRPNGSEAGPVGRTH
ncbi:MAG: hypothetical protein ABJQ98_01810 [Alloalcanivorax venustensis]|jgi:hypothetical protein|uniref:hypothetical protein n=1 Tax=Alloalcanivorax venustensis TaxID=172371 RepID=UPI0032988C6C